MNTRIYHRLTTGKFTGIDIICVINEIYHYRHFTDNLELLGIQQTTGCNEKKNTYRHAGGMVYI